MSRRFSLRGARLPLVLLCALLPLVGCAAIPTESPAKPAGDARASEQAQPAAPPPRDLDPQNLVRQFVEATANPDRGYAAAMPYLTKSAQKAWDTTATVTIIDDTFQTVPNPTAKDQPDLDKQRVVTLRGKNVGQLSASDNAFVPRIPSDVEATLHLERQDDGQWRIADAPPGVFVTEAGFRTNYTQVAVYFYNQDQTILVPDLRWVASAGSSGGVQARVIDALLKGPSDGMKSALRNALGSKVKVYTAVAPADDGSLLVDLSQLPDLTDQTKRQVVAQVVRSLASVTTSRIKVQSDGVDLFADHKFWRPEDITTDDPQTTPNAELRGMVVSGGQVRSLKDGSPVKGPAGTTEYDVQTAAQSLDGSELAVVSKTAQGVKLRVGKADQQLREVDQLPPGDLTRPTWMPSATPGGPGAEVWTVVDHSDVVQVLVNGDTTSTRPVNAGELTSYVQRYGPITDLRLSRDGTRVAAVIGGRLVVGSVARAQDSASIKSARVLQQTSLGSTVTAVDWPSQEAVVVATTSSSQPVVKVFVDGFQVDRFNTSNLTVPITSLAAAPSRPVIAVDRTSMWQATDIGEVWRANPTFSGPNQIAFYPG
ncbi:hypothetical protein F0L68_19310 [Solihabitans fulvus]|uniref:Sporulation and spore germination n=1 Tax=Solihabitans fulvus TaxID=1892852 RepID=A0A5B2XD81_9PSEU|nr:LpqB family beta-propeller domain-containing protein [Solihabitans fulvus]KAA2260949.1 hypothetical protein F0L68_19310 [Solihabitans fulvus]